LSVLGDASGLSDDFAGVGPKTDTSTSVSVLAAGLSVFAVGNSTTTQPVEVSPAGDALSWPSLDVDVYVPGLVERAFGTRLFAAATGRRGGRRKSKAKAVAPKDNGAKGGRPRRWLSA
jgi:hypothetical protein